MTGSGRGLGTAYARALVARGAAAVVHDAGVAPDGSGGDSSLATAVADGIRREGGVAAVGGENLETEDGCRRTVELALEQFGRLDIVVQNAGLLVWEPIEEASRSWDRMRRVNVDAPFYITRAAFPIMKRKGYGRFVFTTSGRAMRVERTGCARSALPRVRAVHVFGGGPGSGRRRVLACALDLGLRDRLRIGTRRA